MNRYTIYCTESQTKKALELGAPINTIRKPNTKVYLTERITAEQMIGWLEEKGVRIYISVGFNGLRYEIRTNRALLHKMCFSSREKATFTAIDDALNYLEKQKEKFKEPLTKFEDSKIDSKESTAYTYEQMATLNIQLQGLINAKDEAFFKLREECEDYKKKLTLIKNVINGQTSTKP